MAFKDHFSAQSEQYTRYRPRYPRELFVFLADTVPARQRAWDCGTGNGQAATGLAEFFAEVVATDPSANQIEHAVRCSNVTYLVSVAEQCPLPRETVDLVTVAQALHWFDLDQFYAEVRRVSTPAGVLAIWSYGLATITGEIDDVVGYLYEDILGTYWPPERKVVEQGYATIPFPFDELPAPRFSMTADWSLEDLVGYLGTWSSTQRFMARHGTNPVDEIVPRLTNAWGRQQVRQIRWPLVLRVGRIG